MILSSCGQSLPHIYPWLSRYSDVPWLTELLSDCPRLRKVLSQRYVSDDGRRSSVTITVLSSPSSHPVLLSLTHYMSYWFFCTLTCLLWLKNNHVLHRHMSKNSTCNLTCSFYSFADQTDLNFIKNTSQYLIHNLSHVFLYCNSPKRLKRYMSKSISIKLTWFAALHSSKTFDRNIRAQHQSKYQSILIKTFDSNHILYPFFIS